MRDKISNHIYIFCISIIYFLFVLFVILSLRSNYLTGDESFTFQLIHHSFHKIILLTSMDVHPFMYYFIAKLFILPFHTKYTQIMSLRILSSIPYLILLLIGNISIKRHFNKDVSLWFMLFIIMMPFLNRYMYIARMYSFAMLFTTLVFLLFIYILVDILSNTYKISLIISLFSLFACYFHYFSIIVIGLIYLVFLILFIIKRKSIKKISFSIVLDCIFYAPWLPILFKQMKYVKNTFWTPPVGLKSMVSPIESISPIMDISHNNEVNLLWVALIIVVLIIIFYLFIYFNLYKYVLIDIGFIIVISTYISSIVLSLLLKHSVMLPRYYTIVLGILWFSISLFITQIPKSNKVIKYNITILFIFIAILSYSINIVNMNMNTNKFNKNSLEVIRQIPRNAKVIYSSKAPISSLSSYSKNNLYLINNYSSSTIYRKVFNIKIKHNIKLNKNYNYYFILSLSNKDRLDKCFMDKYRNHMSRKGIVESPGNGNNSYAILYKIKNA